MLSLDEFVNVVRHVQPAVSSHGTDEVRMFREAIALTAERKQRHKHGVVAGELRAPRACMMACCKAFCV